MSKKGKISRQQLEEENSRLREAIANMQHQQKMQFDSAEAMLLMLEDLSELQNSLENEKDQWQATFDAIRDPVFIHDNEGLIIRANHAYEVACGINHADFIGHPYWHFFPLLDQPLAGCMQENAVADRPSQVVIPFRDKQGRSFVSYSYGVKSQELNAIYEVHFIQDVTRQQEAHQLLAKRTDELHNALEGSILAIAKAVEMRDPYTAGHQQRVGELARAIAYKLELDENLCEGVYYGGLIHDIGKIHIPAEILSWPGRLSQLQYALVQEHPDIGYQILNGLKFPWPIAEIAHQHHERCDGSGYPQGLSDNDIVPEAKIIAIADVVEAMGTDRPYRLSVGLDKALEEIQRGKGKLFEADAVDACIELFRQDHYQLKG